MIDTTTIKQLVNDYGAKKLEVLVSHAETADLARAKKLTNYALVGNLKGVAVEAEALRISAKFLGMQRVANRATELLRLTELENKGQAFLHCQAIANLLATEINQDFKAVSKVASI